MTLPDKGMIKKEALYLLLAFAIITAMFQIIFIKESIITAGRTVAALFWLFVLPGFALMHYWHDKLDFLERLIIGTVLGLAVVGVVGYNLSLLVHMKYHAIL
ncbi:hypothetical protein HYV82_01425, partial [Candidatus Woesearchaeota archaeon]|nr:hypothetical protein [Candidatus Woesearchaeota archaeon]